MPRGRAAGVDDEGVSHHVSSLGVGRLCPTVARVEPYLALDGDQVGGDGEGEAREEAHHEEAPRHTDAATPAVEDGPDGEEQDVGDDVVLGGRVGGPVAEQRLGEVDPARRLAELLDVPDVEVPAEPERGQADHGEDGLDRRHPGQRAVPGEEMLVGADDERRRGHTQHRVNDERQHRQCVGACVVWVAGRGIGAPYRRELLRSV